MAKKDRKPDSADVYFNRLDFTLRHGQDGQTIGIPVGPDASRYVAELICHAVDTEFKKRCGPGDIAFIRHVDDVWIGAQSYADAERALWIYRYCLREYELDINESKTRIYAADFRFADSWPSDVASRLELALAAVEIRRSARLRAALEFAFDLSVSNGDDGVLKYAIRQLDRSGANWDTWAILQPFLMRAAVHFGHTIDYVVRILVWRKLTKDDVDEGRWIGIIRALLGHHGRLGNDSEVCWLLFAAHKFSIKTPKEAALSIVQNCGAMSVVALLDLEEGNQPNKEVFQAATDLVKAESANGPLWPLFLEWICSEWGGYAGVKKLTNSDLIDGMAKKVVYLHSKDALTPVFEGVSSADYPNVPSAIESRISSYDNEDEAAPQA